ncbi:hypothetical protein HJG60_010585 [Phyllostomus discolor]|uniref:Uncharacterized protein n=1 Tax=Phyllostomus discolor TaxID=89673 RepID=A0A834EF76_9CHIR|nr:hypothetical protein HJG60_010585 [Phyllostomus discolor]
MVFSGFSDHMPQTGCEHGLLVSQEDVEVFTALMAHGPSLPSSFSHIFLQVHYLLRLCLCPVTVAGSLALKQFWEVVFASVHSLPQEGSELEEMKMSRLCSSCKEPPQITAEKPRALTVSTGTPLHPESTQRSSTAFKVMASPGGRAAKGNQTTQSCPVHFCCLVCFRHFLCNYKHSVFFQRCDEVDFDSFC